MKKSMGIGADISVLKRFIHPSIHDRTKYVKIEQSDGLVGAWLQENVQNLLPKESNEVLHSIMITSKI